MTNVYQLYAEVFSKGITCMRVTADCKPDVNPNEKFCFPGVLAPSGLSPKGAYFTFPALAQCHSAWRKSPAIFHLSGL